MENGPLNGFHCIGFVIQSYIMPSKIIVGFEDYRQKSDHYWVWMRNLRKIHWMLSWVRSTRFVYSFPITQLRTNGFHLTVFLVLNESGFLSHSRDMKTRSLLCHVCLTFSNMENMFNWGFVLKDPRTPEADRFFLASIGPRLDLSQARTTSPNTVT